MHHRKLVAGLATLSLVAGGTGVALAAGKPPRRADVVAVSTTKVKINRYIQDGLRWNKDVYTVRSGGTLHVVNNAGGRRAAHVHGRQEADLPKTPRAIFNCSGLQQARAGPRRRPEQRGSAEVPVPRERRRLGDRRRTSTAPATRASSTPEKGASVDLKVTAKKGTTLLLHLPRSTRGCRRRSRSARSSACAGRASRGPWRLAGALALCLDRRARPRARVRDYWVAAVPTSWNIVPERARRDHGHARSRPSDAVFPTVVYRRFTPRLAAGRSANAPRSSADGLADPRPADPRPRRRPAARSTSRTWTRCAATPHSMHFHGVHYKPELRRRLRARRSPARDADVKPGQT